MASTSRPPVAFNGSLASKTSASDLLRSSRNSVCGVPLKALGRARLGSKKRDFTVSAKVRKVKKHEYPWPEDPDLNVKGGAGRHLSPFKPLKEKPKPVILEFEKPLMDLKKKIIDVQKMANETGLDFSDQIISLENKYQQALKDLYTHLTPIQRVYIARHPHRPTVLDHIFNITEKFIELHGDRAGYDDPAIVTGLGSINGRTYMFMGHQKGRNSKENIQRNFGMPTPHGYRKALRMMYYADHHGFPIVTFIDTPGAYADLKSEELNQGEAIANNLRTMFGLKVPVISFVIGEGGSGGALAIGCANKLLMLENSVFYVASPEACAAILWKSAKEAPKAAEKLKITAHELCKLQIADGIIPEPLGGAHADPYWTSQQIKIAIEESMDELTKMDTQELLRHRMHKFRKLGGYGERPDPPKRKVPKTNVNMKKKAKPLLPDPKRVVPKSNVNMKKNEKPLLPDPKSNVNMKKKEKPVLPSGTPDVKVVDKNEKLKKLKLSRKNLKLRLKKEIQKYRRAIHYELSEAAKALGLEEKLLMVREEFKKRKDSGDQSMDPALKEKLEQVEDEFNRNLSSAPNYARLQKNLENLEKWSNVLKNIQKANKEKQLKNEINKRFNDIMNHPDLKEKIETLKAEIKATGVSSVMDLNQELKEKMVRLKEEIKTEFAGVFESLGLPVKPLSDAKRKAAEFKNKITKVMEDVVNSTDLKNKIEELKIEVAKSGKAPDAESKAKIQALQEQIKKSLAEAMSSPELNEKHKKLAEEIASKGSNGNLPAESVESSEKSNGSVIADSDVSQSDVLQAESVESSEKSNGSVIADSDASQSDAQVNVDANRSFA